MFSGVSVAEGVSGVSVAVELGEGIFFAEDPGYASGLVSVAVGGISSRVTVAGGEGERVAATNDLKLKGVAVGCETALPRAYVEKIKQIPSSEATMIAMGIKRERSNEERGCIPDSILLPFYPHFFLHGW